METNDDRTSCLKETIVRHWARQKQRLENKDKAWQIIRLHNKQPEDWIYMSISITKGFIQQSNQPFYIDWKLIKNALNSVCLVHTPSPFPSSSSQGSLVHLLYRRRDLWPVLGSLKCPQCELLVPVGDVLGLIGECKDHISQRRQRQTLASTSLSGPANVRLTAS